MVLCCGNKAVADKALSCGELKDQTLELYRMFTSNGILWLGLCPATPA
jgi:hypothetical protein